MPIELPIRVKGYWADGTSWEELTAIEDASSLGVSLALQHPAKIGQVVHLVMPLPRTIRQFDFYSPKYEIYGLVRHAGVKDEDWRLGVQFLSKEAPRGFEERPWARYGLPADVADEDVDEATITPPRLPPPEPTPEPDVQRRFDRFDVFVGFMLEPVDETGQARPGELAVSENVSHGGARFKTSLDLNRGSIVAVSETESGFEARAEVRNSYVGPDGVRRINVMFLDGKSPDRLVGEPRLP